MTFQNLGLVAPILKALKAVGYETPTPIQQQAIPQLLDGQDLLASAQTGTGKTAAFAIPIIQGLYQDFHQGSSQRKIRALIVTPTRELALQIDENFKLYSQYTGLRSTVIFGGVKQGKQVATLKRGVDILVATPGRLLDLLGQGIFKLDQLEYFVLDEADQMLDMGFIHDIRRIIKVIPEKRQSLFFSATMPQNIVELSQQILTEPSRISIAPEKPTAERVDQAVYLVSKKAKRDLLVHLLKEQKGDSCLVFSRTKYGADKLVKMLRKKNIGAAAIHGNKSQNARQKALKEFKEGKNTVLIATDIAARGIDVSQLSLVIQYDLPNVPETYVHRIGRTGRAKASGRAVAFCSADERPLLKDIQKLIRQQVPLIPEHPFMDEESEGEVPYPAQEGRSGRKPNKPNSGNQRQKSNGRSGGRNNNNRRRRNNNRKRKPSSNRGNKE
ncbi:MAG: DEAD/DEAH box helicase [Bacteroidota bacterium]